MFSASNNIMLFASQIFPQLYNFAPTPSAGMPRSIRWPRREQEYPAPAQGWHLYCSQGKLLEGSVRLDLALKTQIIFHVFIDAQQTQKSDCHHGPAQNV